MSVWDDAVAFLVGQARQASTGQPPDLRKPGLAALSSLVAGHPSLGPLLATLRSEPTNPRPQEQLKQALERVGEQDPSFMSRIVTAVDQASYHGDSHAAVDQSINVGNMNSGPIDIVAGAGIVNIKGNRNHVGDKIKNVYREHRGASIAGGASLLAILILAAALVFTGGNAGSASEIDRSNPQSVIDGALAALNAHDEAAYDQLTCPGSDSLKYIPKELFGTLKITFDHGPELSESSARAWAKLVIGPGSYSGGFTKEATVDATLKLLNNAGQWCVNEINPSQLNLSGGSAPANPNPTTTPAPTAHSQPQWLKLPGHTDIATASALLVRDNMAQGLTWHVIGTRTDVDTILRPSIVGASINERSDGAEIEGILEDATSEHSMGVAVLSVLATIPSSGLQPNSTSAYLKSYDALTGRELHSVRVVDASPVAFTPIYIEGNKVAATWKSTDGEQLYLGVIDASTGSITIQRNMAKDEVAGYSGRQIYLLTMAGSDNCHRLESYDSISLQRSATLGECFGEAIVESLTNYGVAQYSPSNSTVAGGIIVIRPTGDQVGMLPCSQDGHTLGPFGPWQSGNVPGRIRSGPRSNVAVSYSVENNQDVIVHDTTAWSKLNSISASQAQQLSLEIRGVSDNQIWIKNDAQNAVVDARDGSVKATGWTVTPDYGGTGWTVADGEGSTIGYPPQYLLRYDGPLVDALATAPTQ